jgi:hypothetical protein
MFPATDQPTMRPRADQTSTLSATSQTPKTGLSSTRGVAALRESLGFLLSDALREYLEQAEGRG